MKLTAERRIDECVHESYYYDNLESLARRAVGLLRELQEELELELNELAHRLTPINPNSLDLERRAREFLDGKEEKK